MLDYATLKLIWWVLIGVLLIGFAITDGMDMGVGMLLPFLGRTDSERRVIINTVGPHWDGNQVWFITAGGAIFAAWPIVYSAAFSGFYLAMLLVLVGLFTRPVGFDYRSKIDDTRWRNAWDWALFTGGLVPALIFGVAFGNLLQGVPFHLDDLMRTHYQGSLLTALLPLLNPFALVAGLISVLMLAAHGGLWLQLRAAPVVAARARAVAPLLLLAVVVLFALAGLWVAMGIDGYHLINGAAPDAPPNPLDKSVELVKGGWLTNYARFPLAIVVPTLGFAGEIAAALLSRAGKAGLAFTASALGLAGVIGTAGVSMFPFLMPSSTVPNSSLTLWDATSSPLTLTVMFWVVAIFLPVMLSYTVWCYVRMWGRVTVEDIEASHTAY